MLVCFFPFPKRGCAHYKECRQTQANWPGSCYPATSHSVAPPSQSPSPCWRPVLPHMWEQQPTGLGVPAFLPFMSTWFSNRSSDRVTQRTSMLESTRELLICFRKTWNCTGPGLVGPRAAGQRWPWPPWAALPGPSQELRRCPGSAGKAAGHFRSLFQLLREGSITPGLVPPSPGAPSGAPTALCPHCPTPSLHSSSLALSPMTQG